MDDSARRIKSMGETTGASYDGSPVCFKYGAVDRFCYRELFDPLEMKSRLRLSYSFASEGVLREGIQRLIGIAHSL